MQGRNLEVGTEAETLEEGCSLANSLPVAQKSFKSEANLLRDGIAHSGLSMPT